MNPVAWPDCRPHLVLHYCTIGFFLSFPKVYFLLFLFVYMSLCVCAHECRCLKEPEEGDIGAGVTGGFESSPAPPPKRDLSSGLFCADSSVKPLSGQFWKFLQL